MAPLCRICLTQLNINLCTGQTGKSVRLERIYSYCTGIYSTFKVPFTLCEKCSQKLKTFCKFKSLCIKSDRKLKKSLKRKGSDFAIDFNVLLDSTPRSPSTLSHSSLSEVEDSLKDFDSDVLNHSHTESISDIISEPPPEAYNEIHTDDVFEVVKASLSKTFNLSLNNIDVPSISPKSTKENATNKEIFTYKENETQSLSYLIKEDDEDDSFSIRNTSLPNYFDKSTNNIANLTMSILPGKCEETENSNEKQNNLFSYNIKTPENTNDNKSISNVSQNNFFTNSNLLHDFTSENFNIDFNLLSPITLSSPQNVVETVLAKEECILEGLEKSITVNDGEHNFVINLKVLNQETSTNIQSYTSEHNYINVENNKTSNHDRKILNNNNEIDPLVFSDDSLQSNSEDYVVKYKEEKFGNISDSHNIINKIDIDENVLNDEFEYGTHITPKNNESSKHLTAKKYINTLHEEFEDDADITPKNNKASKHLTAKKDINTLLKEFEYGTDTIAKNNKASKHLTAKKDADITPKNNKVSKHLTAKRYINTLHEEFKDGTDGTPKKNKASKHLTAKKDMNTDHEEFEDDTDIKPKNHKASKHRTAKQYINTLDEEFKDGTDVTPKKNKASKHLTAKKDIYLLRKSIFKAKQKDARRKCNAEQLNSRNCPQCCEVYFSEVKLKKHLTQHASYSIHRCNVCYCCFDSRENLLRHVKAEHLILNSVVQLDLQPKAVINMFQRQLLAYSPKEISKYIKSRQEMRASIPCPYCESNFISQISLHYHCKNQHAKNYNKGIPFPMENYTENDTKINLIKVYTCEHCERIFQFRKCFIKHLGHVHALDINNPSHSVQKHKNYICDYCGKCTTRKYQLLIHIRSHLKTLNNTKIICKICKLVFKTKGLLSNHKRTHIVRDTNARKRTDHQGSVQCPLCEKTFSKIGNMHVHLKRHNNHMGFFCCFCSKGFVTSSDLKRHERVHVGNQPYQCSVCKKRFARSDKLAGHMRVHTGEKPYQCEICNFAFRNACMLIKHKKDNHSRVDNTQETPKEIDILTNQSNDEEWEPAFSI